jgi:gluconolactonase
MVKRLGVIRLDPSLDALISRGAKIEKLADGFGFTEGPVWVHSDGLPYLIFSDIPANVINKWTADGKVSVFLEKSGFTGADPGDAGYRLNKGHTTVTLYGSNGHRAG